MNLRLDGNLVRLTRLTTGYSQAHLAQMVGMSSVVLARIENNHTLTTRRLTLEQVVRLAELLGLDPTDLLKSDTKTTEDKHGEDRALQRAAQLVATLAASPRAVKPGDIVDRFGWRHTDLAAAIRTANTQLSPVGVVLNDDPKGLSIRPRSSVAYDDAAAILNTRSTLEGLDSYYLKVLWRIHTHRVYPGTGVQSSRSRQTYALLQRIGLVEPLANGFVQTKQFAYAFPDLDDADQRHTRR